MVGSERLAKTEVDEERSKEAKFIKKSLSALGDVIASLGSKMPTSHIGCTLAFSEINICSSKCSSQMVHDVLLFIFQGIFSGQRKGQAIYL